MAAAMLRMAALSLAILALPFAAGAASRTPETFAHSDIPGVATELTSLDVYADGRPDGAPVVLFVHGGGWVGGSKSNVQQAGRFLQFFEDRGMVLVSTGTRLVFDARSPDATFREQATEASARRAIEYYRRAIEIEPNYALAHAGLSDAYRLLGAPGWEVDKPSTLLSRAKAAVERALALDPNSPEAHAVVAMIKFNYDWDLPGAEAEIKEALRLNPSFAQAHIAVAVCPPHKMSCFSMRILAKDPNGCG